MVNQQIFWFQVSMHNVQFMQVLNTRDDLMEKFTGKRLFYFLIFHDEIEQLTTRNVFHDQVQLLWCFNNLVQLNYIRMSNHFQNMDFSCYPLHVIYILNLIFLENFDCDLFLG